MKQTLTTSWGTYSRGQTLRALELICEDGEPWTTASVNMGHCPDGCMFIKDWSENMGMIEALKEAGVIAGDPVVTTQSGFVTVKAYRLTDEAIAEYNQQKGNRK